MKKITRAEAKKLYDGGKSIYLNPSKMRPNSVWHQALKVSKAMDFYLTHLNHDEIVFSKNDTDKPRPNNADDGKRKHNYLR